MKDNDLNIEDFKEIFLKSFFGETVSIQEISNHFELESVKFQNRFSNENLTQRIKDIIFKKFINGIEEANTNLSKPFIEYEENRRWDMMEWQGKGIDISEMEKPSKYLHVKKLHELCEKLSGADIWLEQIELIYQGFKLFRQQHEKDSNKPAPIANNLDTFLEIMTKMELADNEVFWQEYHSRIIDFSHIEVDNPIYKEWEYKKIKVKTLGGFDSNFDNKIKPIIENIEKYEFKNLDREGKKNYINNLEKSQKIVIDCMERVQKLQDAFDADTKSKKMYSNSVQQTRYFTYALFKEMLSEPMHMNLPYYNDENVTRHFRTGDETVYITEGLLRCIYGNLESRRDCIGILIHELSKVFNPLTLNYEIPVNEQLALYTTEQPTNKKPIKDKPIIPFKNMFKESSQYDKVLGYVGEYLTDTNQWTGTKIYLSAFYGVLRDRGYLNKIYTAPQINNALRNEFGIECTDKNFQDTKINIAVETYAEAFNMIPSLKNIK